MRGSLGLVAGLCALLACLHPARAAPGQAVSPSPTLLRVVGDNSYPPYMFTDADGRLQGYEVDMWRLFQRHTGIRVELLPASWATAQRDVISGRADVIGMIFRTPDRETLYDFSAPYSTLPVGIYVDRRIPGVHDVASLKGLAVGVEHGDACADKLREQGVASLQEFPDYRSMIKAASSGHLRIFCSEENPANYYLYRDSSLDRFERAFVLYEGQFHHAVRKGNTPVLATVERGMAMITPQERQALREKWLARPRIFTSWMRMTGIAVGIGLGVLVLMTLWIWVLGRSVQARTREIAASENKLRALFDASPDAMWVKDLSGIYRECNDRTLDILGIERKQLIGQSDHALFPPEELPEVLGTDLQAIQTGETRIFYANNTVADGSQKHLEVIKVPLRGADGAVMGILGVARDITARARMEDQLRLWAHAFQYAAFGVVIFDARRQQIMMANPSFARDRGYTPEEMAGMPVDALYPPDLVEDRRRVRQEINAQEHTVVETEHIARDGRRFPVQLDISISRDAEGQPQYVIVYAQDIGQRKQDESELRLAAVAFQTLEAMLVLDAGGVIQRVNAAFTILTGFEAEEALGKEMASLLDPQQDNGALQRLWAQVRREDFWLGEQWVAVKRGQPRIARLEISAVPNDSGKAMHYVCAMTDLTSEREAHARAEHMAFFDALTDLPNRNFLTDRLQHVLMDDTVTTGALLLIDLDHFKRVNDLRGHATGDRLLAFIAQRLRALLGENDVLGRFSGGTFAVLLPCKAHQPEPCDTFAPRFAERVREALREPFWLGSTAPISITVSIGWTKLHPHQGTADAAFKEVELAMYAAKTAGRDKVQRFDPSMLTSLEHQEALASELLSAVAGDIGGLDLHMQLQIDRAGHAVGAEALLRFTRPDGSRVPPDVFIPMAEQSGLILPLGDWVLQRACERLVQWSGNVLTRELSLAVNVSARQFAQPGFVDDVQHALAHSGANPARLKLEITETAIIGDLDEIAAKLRQLREMGIRISLDDFGTGYSSLAYLSRLPLDQLKIDRSFISRLPEEGNDATVSQTIIGMGRGLGLEVIAEGVETEAQRDFLAMHGCDAFQGYLFARPLPLAEFETLLLQHARAA